ncbi:hypothetical protein C9374_012792 [Naegleria lovaniensis]|uniref:Phosphoglycerate kinase n=1 Tax=Naegleria lovaniensis TaxID=51637 RepID=A0AA88KBN0_NAELO|nr:uncharacterized protein C9374_012792 [Naegleria lovaniensis]KAG2373190.1 hypothetical protein C9374_012792 [Naegleria lovaniensis]
MNKKSIEDVNLSGKRVLVRVDYNVPLKNGIIKDNTRIKETIPTLKYILDHGATQIVLMSHLGRPDGKVVPDASLEPVAKELEKLLGESVRFAKDCVGSDSEKAVLEEKAKIVLLENLRFHPEEEVLKGTSDEAVEKFRAQLAKYGDVYVNDAFGTAHRPHSSMVGLKRLGTCVSGFLLKKELDYFRKALVEPQRPFVAILGGAKVKDKIKLIENMLDKVDEMIIVGGMAFTFKKVCFGVSIGKSLFDEEGSKIVEGLLEKAKKNGVKLHFPIDHVCANAVNDTAEKSIYTDEQGIPDDLMGLDIGPQSIELFKQVILGAKTLVWNGPAGVFEIKQFATGSVGLLDAVATATEKGLVSIIGGGDTVSLVCNNGAQNKVSHISTGGGASLELLEGRKLPGVEALDDK